MGKADSFQTRTSLGFLRHMATFYVVHLSRFDTFQVFVGSKREISAWRNDIFKPPILQ
jgi:hypothetical protein